MVSAKTTKQIFGALKPEIRRLGQWTGNWIATHYPQLGEIGWVERIVGFLTESLESALPGHAILGPGTSAVSDALEQAMPRIWGEFRTRGGGESSVTPEGAPSDPFAKAFAEALRELMDIPYGIPEDERERRLDEVKARLYRELDRIVEAKELREVFEKHLKELLGAPERPERDRKEASKRIRKVRRQAVEHGLARETAKGRYQSPVVEALGLTADIVVTTTTKAARATDEAAEALAERMRQARERNTENGVLVTKRQRQRRKAKAEREASRIEQKRQRLLARDEKRREKEAKHEARQNAKAERRAQRLEEKRQRRVERRGRHSKRRTR